MLRRIRVRNSFASAQGASALLPAGEKRLEVLDDLAAVSGAGVIEAQDDSTHFELAIDPLRDQVHGLQKLREPVQRQEMGLQAE